MPPKIKESTKKPPPQINRPQISKSSLVYVPEDAVEGFQERIETGIAWTRIDLAKRHHKRFKDQDVPAVTFSDALRTKIKNSILSGFLDLESTLTLQELYEVIIPITIWDNEKFATVEGKICFKCDNSITDDLDKILKKVVRLNDKDMLMKELRRVTILRLLDARMTGLDPELLKFKNLQTLNVCGNLIATVDPACLPQCLRCLEMQSNYVKTVEGFADNLPESLMYLGLSSNLLVDGMVVFIHDESIEFFSHLPRSITVLDLSDNDICTLDVILQALASLPCVRSLLLAGNPCAMCAVYSRTVLSCLPRLRWLDAREVFPKDRPEDPFEPHHDDLRTAYFTFAVIRIMGTPQPPKTEKGVTTSFHVELELPLLDSTRRGFLMFRRYESMVEFLPPPEDDEWPTSKSKLSSTEPSSKPIIDEENTSSQESDIYEHLVAKDSRMISNFRTFETNKIQWNKMMLFQEPAVKIFCPDLSALRDTFRSEITLRFVYTVYHPQPKPGKDNKDKKSAVLLKSPPAEQRVLLAAVRCALRRPDWSQHQQHFHWDDSLGTNDAIHWGDGDLTALQYTTTATKPVKGKTDVTGRLTPPDNLTIHIAFGIEPPHS